MQSPWAWSDSVSSWTWPGFEGAPVTVEVYADADEVALLLDGVEVARAAGRRAAADARRRSRPSTARVTLVAVALPRGRRDRPHHAGDRDRPDQL